MMSDSFALETRLASIESAIENLIRAGVIAEVDYDNALVTVALEGLTTGWVQWLTQRAGPDKTWWAPEVGEQVFLFSPLGLLEHGVVLPALYSVENVSSANLATQHVIEYADGAVIRYDREAHALSATLPAGATIELVSDGGITITGDVSITGNLTVDGDAAASGDVEDGVGKLSRLRGNYNQHKHVGNLGAPTSPNDKLDA